MTTPPPLYATCVVFVCDIMAGSVLSHSHTLLPIVGFVGVVVVITGCLSVECVSF